MILSVIIVTTAGFATSATSAKELLNCWTTEFCENKLFTKKNATVNILIIEFLFK